MDKNINVSIAGIPFIMDGKAYGLLKEYLAKIKLAYGGTADGDEIISDIEARISELILNEQPAEIAVPDRLIGSIIDQLGQPDDFNTDDKESASEDPTVVNTIEADSLATDPSNIKRRLYRNREGSKIAGVCSGLGVYFDIEAVIIRLLFCAPLIVLPITLFFEVLNSGIFIEFHLMVIVFNFITYILLWFTIPKAKTPRQRLEMTGSRVTAKSIGRTAMDQSYNTAHRADKDGSQPRTLAIEGRLYRSGEGSKLAGVCSGLGTYFNLDAAIVRLIFCLPFLMIPISIFISHHNSDDVIVFNLATCSISVILYIVLWVTTMKAKTPRQKLEMKNTKVTANSIEDRIKEDYKYMSHTPEDPKNERNASVLADFIYIIGKVFIFCIKLFMLLVGFAIAGAIIGVIVGVIRFTTRFGSVKFLISDLFAINPPVFAIISTLLVILPLIVIGSVTIRTALGIKSKNKSMSTLLSIWLIMVIFSGSIFIKNFDKIRTFVNASNWSYWDCNNNNVNFWVDSTDEDGYKLGTEGYINSDLQITSTMISDTLRIDSVIVDNKLRVDSVKVEYFNIE